MYLESTVRMAVIGLVFRNQKQLELDAHRNGGITTLGIVQRACECDTWGYGLVVNTVVLG